MKKRNAFIFSLLALLLVVCVSSGLVMHGYRREQASRELILAIKANETDRALDALRANADPNVRDQGDEAPSLRRYLSTLWQQIYGIKPVTPTVGATALTLAVEHNNSVLAETLLARGAKDIDQSAIEVDAYEPTASSSVPLLVIAVQHKNPSIVQALVRHGSDVNAVDENHETALFYAEDAATAKALLDCGAGINVVNENGETPLTDSLAHISRRELMHDVGNYLRGKPLKPIDDLQTGVVLLLIREGADVNFQSRQGNTPLLIATNGSHRYLDGDGQWPTVIKALLSRGAQVNVQDNSGMTPLMVAASNLHPTLVRILLQHGARVNIRTGHGETAISLAGHRDRFGDGSGRRKQSEVVRLLKWAGEMSSP